MHLSKLTFLSQNHCFVTSNTIVVLDLTRRTS
jgi:hypothetical protein